MKELKASDEDPPCPLMASSYLLRGVANQAVTLTVDPDAAFDFAGLTGVTITSETGPEFAATVSGWDDDHIYLVFSVDEDAAHNEVYTAQLTYGASSTSYTGLLWIMSDPVDPSDLPHAVGGTDLTVSANDPVELDGSASYHDDSGVGISVSWSIDLGGGERVTFGSDMVSVELPVGTYTARLHVQDDYGRISIDEVLVTVTE